MAVTGHLEQPTRGWSLRFRSGLYGVGHTSPPIWPCSDWGLPCPLAYARGGGLLPHRFTLTSPWPSGLLEAVCFLWPYPSPYGAQALPGSLPDGARTFLGAVSAWLRDHLVLPV